MSERLEVSKLSFLDWSPISFSVAAGECVGLSGESGSGKSLLLRAIADLDPHGGEVFLEGAASASIPAPSWRRSVGFLPAESRWWFDIVGPHFLGEDGVGGLFGDLGFDGDEVMDWEVRRLSAGERQRLALARMLERAPKVLLLDEPTANLDPRSTELVENVVERYRAASSAAVVWVTHDDAQVGRVATRRMMMADKKLEEVS